MPKEQPTNSTHEQKSPLLESKEHEPENRTKPEFKYSGTTSLRRSITPIGFFFGQSPSAQSGENPKGHPAAHPQRPPRKPWKTPFARAIASSLVALASGVIWYWLNVPALNVSDMGFWVMLFWICLVYTLVNIYLRGSANKPAGNPFKHMFLNAKVPTCAMVVIVAAMIAGSIPALAGASETLNTHGDGTNVVNGGIANEDPDGDATVAVDATTALASARQLLENDSELGESYDIVPIESYDEGPDGPRWVFAIGQQDAMPSPESLHQSSPAYVSVDASNGEACIVTYENPMRFSPSNVLLGNVQRRLRANYPFLMFGNIHLEFERNGTPCWVATTVKHMTGLFGGSKATGALVMNAVTGECSLYDLENIPNWIDRF